LKMKKIAIASALALAAFAASAANFVQVEQENVVGRQGQGGSAATYLRASKDLGDYSIGLQSRTARFDTGGIANSLETTIANNKVSILGITPFVGVGHDFGGTTTTGYNYGLVGATTGVKVGPGFALLGAKTRVMRQNDTDPKQTVAFASYGVPVAKNVSLNVGLSRSGGDIKERGTSVGLSFGF
jgi:opacity protein-like surface antigen